MKSNASLTGLLLFLGLPMWAMGEEPCKDSHLSNQYVKDERCGRDLEITMRRDAEQTTESFEASVSKFVKIINTKYLFSKLRGLYGSISATPSNGESGSDSRKILLQVRDQVTYSMYLNQGEISSLDSEGAEEVQMTTHPDFEWRWIESVHTDGFPDQRTCFTALSYGEMNKSLWNLGKKTDYVIQSYTVKHQNGEVSEIPELRSQSEFDAFKIIRSLGSSPTYYFFHFDSGSCWSEVLFLESAGDSLSKD